MTRMRLETGSTASAASANLNHTVPLVTGSVLRSDADVRFDGYGHAWIAPTSLAPTTLAPLNDEERQAEGLRGFARAAGSRRAALLDAQPQGCGRDASALARLSKKSGVAIATVTGFHLAAHYPTGRRPWITADAALATFQRELEGGMREQPMARPAAVAATLGADAPDDDPCWEAALEACRQSGALLLVRLEPGADLGALIRFLASRDVPAERTYVCRMETQPDDGLHRELVSSGALLGYGAGAFIDDGARGAVSVAGEAAGRRPRRPRGDRARARSPGRLGGGPHDRARWRRDRARCSRPSSDGCASWAPRTATSTGCWAGTC